MEQSFSDSPRSYERKGIDDGTARLDSPVWKRVSGILLPTEPAGIQAAALLCSGRYKVGIFAGKPSADGWIEEKGRVITVMRKLSDSFDMPIGVGRQLPEGKTVWLRMTVQYGCAQFFYSLDGRVYEKLGPELEAWRMSDEEGPGRFTGAFFCICCQDISGRRKEADFDFVEYQILDEQEN